MIRSVLYILIIFSFSLRCKRFLRRTVLLRILLTIGARPLKISKKIVLVQKVERYSFRVFKKGRRGVVLRFFCATRRNGSFFFQHG